MKPKLIVLPLEPYKARYTEQLSAWETAAFSEHFEVVNLVPETPATENRVILAGQVLDTVGRPMWALEQILMLLEYISNPANFEPGEVPRIYFSDFFHPGLEALAYSRIPVKAFSFLWAQSYDRYDFTRPMHRWMRPYETMAFNIFAKVFVASDILRDLITTAHPGLDDIDVDRVPVVGLPFNSSMVFSQLTTRVLSKDIDVVYSSRFDAEKRPHFFLDIVEAMQGTKFAICTGHEVLRGDPSAVERAWRIANSPDSNLTIFTGLEKSDYYAILARSHVQLNTGLQDWVSFTLLEALTFGCKPVYPMWRDFPSTLFYERLALYNPENPNSAMSRIESLLASEVDSPRQNSLREAVLGYHNSTLGRIAAGILSV